MLLSREFELYSFEFCKAEARSLLKMFADLLSEVLLFEDLCIKPGYFPPELKFSELKSLSMPCFN